MRRYLSVLLFLALFIGLGTKVYAESRIIYSDALTLNEDDDIRHYQYVRNTNQTAADTINGEVVIWDIRSATNTSLDNRWSVTTTTVAAHPLVAGVWTQATDVDTRGWIQTYGIHTAARITGTVNPESTILETSTTRGRGQPTTAASRGQYAKPLARNGSGTAAITVFVDTD